MVLYGLIRVEDTTRYFQPNPFAFFGGKHTPRDVTLDLFQLITIDLQIEICRSSTFFTATAK